MIDTVASICLVLLTVVAVPPAAAQHRTDGDVGTASNQGFLVAFEIDPETSEVAILPTGAGNGIIINDQWDLQSIECLNCGPPCIVPAQRIAEVTLTATEAITGGYGVSNLTSSDYFPTDVQYSTQASLNLNETMTITITGDVLDCGNSFQVYLDLCDVAPTHWTDPCSP